MAVSQEFVSLMLMILALRGEYNGTDEIGTETGTECTAQADHGPV